MKKILLTSAAVLAITLGTACTSISNNDAIAAESKSSIPVARPNNQCLTPDEKAAFNSRVLQTELMVAALSCPEHKNNYNSFIKKFQGELAANGKNLQSYFKKNYGPLGENRLNKFVTKLANDTSQVNYGQQQSGFCRYADDQFARLNKVKKGDLDKFLVDEEYVVGYSAPTCER